MMVGKRVLIWHFKYSFLAAFLYAISLVWFIKADDFQAIWFLYVGNFLFGLGILSHILNYHPAANIKNKFARKILAGHMVTVAGIILSCVFILILFLIFLPEVFQNSAEGNKSLANRPAQMRSKTQGVMFVVYLNNIVGNISAGSFISILFSFVVGERKPVEGS